MNEKDRQRGRDRRLMHIHLADDAILSRMVQRKRRLRPVGSEVDLRGVLTEILTRASELIPSESGSILFDDPHIKLTEKRGGTLYFIACFGQDSQPLIGTPISVDAGIAGHAYRTGKPYISEDVAKDKLFYTEIREKTQCEIRSLICAPIAIHESVIGVIELINKRGGAHFTENDLALLEIFAGYTSTLVQNALDARRFEELSKRDNLTGLYNDRYFLERLPWEVRRVTAQGGDLSIIFLDLDRFKEVNDTYGHLAGSQVLREIAVLVNEVFEGMSAITARYGGDEFIIILPDTTLKVASRYAERLRALIAGTIFIREGLHADSQPLNISGLITASVGVASLTQNVAQKEDEMDVVGGLIKAADSAMYRAKDLGKNRVALAEGKI